MSPLAHPAKINGIPEKKIKILLAPLDWGLGHATRCIPIVKELLRLKCEVIIAAGGRQKALLMEEFPDLSFVELPGYRVKYGKNRAFTWLKIIGQIPKILIAIKAEKAWFRRFLEREKPDLVISDNRYGLHHPDVFSVFITHQLRIHTPFGTLIDSMLMRIQYRFLRAFSMVWIPDMPEHSMTNHTPPLAGDLSHPRRMPSIPNRYIGPLSRFGNTTTRPSPSSPIDLLILLSGPEPQRTIFEQMLLRQLAVFPGKTILMRGLPVTQPTLSHALPNVTVYNHLPSATLNELIIGSDLILTRPGYTSIMELIPLFKKCIFVATPGQTEQEYLAQYLSAHQWALERPQKGFSLAEAIEAARRFPYAKCMEMGIAGEMPLGVGVGAQPLREAAENLLQNLQARALG